VDAAGRAGRRKGDRSGHGSVVEQGRQPRVRRRASEGGGRSRRSRWALLDYDHRRRDHEEQSSVSAQVLTDRGELGEAWAPRSARAGAVELDQGARRRVRAGSVGAAMVELDQERGMLASHRRRLGVQGRAPGRATEPQWSGRRAVGAGAREYLEPAEHLADQVDRFHRPPSRCASGSPEPPQPSRHGDRDDREPGDDGRWCAEGGELEVPGAPADPETQGIGSIAAAAALGHDRM